MIDGVEDMKESSKDDIFFSISDLEMVTLKEDYRRRHLKGNTENLVSDTEATFAFCSLSPARPCSGRSDSRIPW